MPTRCCSRWSGSLALVFLLLLISLPAQVLPMAPPTPRTSATVTPTPAAAVGLAQINAHALYLPFLAQGSEGILTPEAPGDASYVTLNWDTPVRSPIPGDPHDVPLAFRAGYNADAGAPDSHIIIAFGRQVDPADVERECLPENMWGVQLVRQTGDADPTGCRGIRSNLWVREVAFAYMQGYAANPAHPRTRIGIGTNNSPVGWACDPSNTSQWRVAGREWRALVDALEADENFGQVDVVSAIDVESWFGEHTEPIPGFPDGWYACGTATLSWFDGFDGGGPVDVNIIFGSEPFVEYEPAWTRVHVKNIYFDRPSSRAFPQIYCGEPDSEAFGDQAASWGAYARIHTTGIFFTGVTSENAGRVLPSQCPTDTLGWEEAWQELNGALADARQDTEHGILGGSVISYNYPGRN